MAEEDEVLSRELAIVARLEENGITVSSKSRAVAAFDRLVGSLFDVPAAYFEGVAGKTRLKNEIRKRLHNAQARIAEGAMERMPDLGNELINDVLGDRARRQTNSAAVAIEAIEAIKALPPPDEKPDSTTDDGTAEQLDEDWMNQFVRYAEDASSDRLQQIWGRVLAGEIQSSGKFSRPTLRFLSELDKETAENCEFVARHLVGDWFFSGEQWNSGAPFLIGIDLQRLGLIEGAGSFGPQQSFTITSNGYVIISGKSWGLLLRGEENTEISFPVMMLTRMGKEVMSLLAAPDEQTSLREIFQKVNKRGLESISLGQIVMLPNGNGAFNAKSAQEVWRAEAPGVP